MNANMLRGKIVAKGYTIERFCEEAGFNRATFDRKLSGKYEFDRAEIRRIITVLELTDEEVRAIFFAEEVA